MTGERALQHAYQQFPKKFVNKGVKRVLRQITKDIIVRDAQRLTPVNTGLLKRTIKVRTAKNKNGGRLQRHIIGFAAQSVKTKTQDAYYAKWVFLDAKNRDGTTRKGTRSLRRGLYDNAQVIKAKTTSDLRREVPKIAREVRIDSLRYKG